MIQTNILLSSKDFSKGLNTRSDILRNDPNTSPNCMDIKWYFDGAIGKRFGASSTNTLSIGSGATAGWTIDSGGNLSTNLAAYWKLDEAAGDRFDAFGTSTLFDSNTVGSIVGIRGQAALFTAANSMSLIRQTTSPVESAASFFFNTWFYLNSANGAAEQTILSKRDPDVDAATVLLLHCDGVDASTSFPDSSPSSKTVTANGNAQVDTAQFKFGTGSALFDGSGDYLSSVDSPDWDFGTGDFTIEFSLRFNTVATCVFVDRDRGIAGYSFDFASGNLRAVFNNSLVKTEGWAPTTGVWYNICYQRKAGSLSFLVDGVELGTGTVNTTDLTSAAELRIGADALGNFAVDGWIDEIRLSKGVARYSGNFTIPAFPFAVKDYEYWLFINTDNVVTFRVSSSGTTQNGQVRASSLGAVNTSTWYRVIAWHSDSSHIGLDVNLSVNTAPYTSNVRIGSAPFVLGALSDGLAGSATKYFNGRIDETGIWKRGPSAANRVDLYNAGVGNTYTAGASGFGWAMFDFGGSTNRFLTVAAGTGIVASSNLGATFFSIATSRTQTYQYLDRSKNVLIATSDAYDVPLYWAGSVGTFAAALAPNSAPLAKYSVNYQGFLILLNFMNSNGVLRNRGFSYADENLQLTDTWQNSFDMPSSADDEITAGFILNKFLYVSTKYRIFRVAFVGGNPDWSYLKVRDWGYVPRTPALMTLKGTQVIVGLDWNRRERIFDGTDDLFLSDNVENDNRNCDFSMRKISLAGSGLTVCHAAVDPIEQEYRLNVAIGTNSTQTTHAIVLNGRTLAMYPYSNQQYQAMCTAESAGQLHLMAVDRSGFVHILNSGNLDVAAPINEYYDSCVIYKDNPLQVSKSQQINLFFNVTSSGSLFYLDSIDMSWDFSRPKILRDPFGAAQILGTEQVLQVLRTVDVPATFNTYQFRLSSFSNRANPWKLTRYDFIQQIKGVGAGA